MKLIDFISLADENYDVSVLDAHDHVIAKYDGKESIPNHLNSAEVTHLVPLEGSFMVWVEDSVLKRLSDEVMYTVNDYRRKTALYSKESMPRLSNEIYGYARALYDAEIVSWEEMHFLADYMNGLEG